MTNMKKMLGISNFLKNHLSHSSGSIFENIVYEKPMKELDVPQKDANTRGWVDSSKVSLPSLEY